jgi:hypothetical protein
VSEREAEVLFPVEVGTFPFVTMLQTVLKQSLLFCIYQRIFAGVKKARTKTSSFVELRMHKFLHSTVHASSWHGA